MDTIIDGKDLKKTYKDGTEAVKGITFNVERGEFFGFLGPNGAGKSTTMWKGARARDLRRGRERLPHS